MAGLTEGIYSIKNWRAEKYLNGDDPAHLYIFSKHDAKDPPKWELRKATGGWNFKATTNQQWMYCAAATKGTKVGLDANNKTTFDIMTTSQGWVYVLRVLNDDVHDSVLDLSGGNLADWGRVDLMTLDLMALGGQQPTQTWMFERISDFEPPLYTNPDLKPGRYIIRNSSVGSVLDLTDGVKLDGTTVTARDFVEAKNQLWDLVPGPKGYMIKNVASESYLSLYPTTPAGDGVHLFGHSNKSEWDFKKVGKVFQLNLVGTKLVLDLPGNNPAWGAEIVLWPSGKEANQKWDLQVHA